MDKVWEGGSKIQKLCHPWLTLYLPAGWVGWRLRHDLQRRCRRSALSVGFAPPWGVEDVKYAWSLTWPSVTDARKESEASWEVQWEVSSGLMNECDWIEEWTLVDEWAEGYVNSIFYLILLCVRPFKGKKVRHIAQLCCARVAWLEEGGVPGWPRV